MDLCLILTLPPPLSLSPPSHPCKHSLTLVPSLSLSCPSAFFYIKEEEGGGREKDKREKVREERVREDLYR